MRFDAPVWLNEKIAVCDAIWFFFDGCGRSRRRYLPIYTVSRPETPLTSAVSYWMLNSPLRIFLFSIVIVYLFLHVCVKKAQFSCKPDIKTYAVPEVSWVSVVTCLWPKVSGKSSYDSRQGIVGWFLGFDSLDKRQTISSSNRPDRLWGPPSLLFSMYICIIIIISSSSSSSSSSFVFVFGTTATSGPGPPHSRGF